MINDDSNDSDADKDDILTSKREQKRRRKLELWLPYHDRPDYIAVKKDHID